MEFALLLRELLRHRLLLIVGVLIAAIAAIFSVYHLEGSKLKARTLQYSSATTQVLVDTPASVLGNVSQSFEPLSARAVVYANFMASPAVLKVIGQHAGIPGDQLYAAGPVDELQPRAVQEPTALKRNVQITGETTPYRLNFNSTTNLPTITVYSQAPTTAQAVALANGAVAGLKQYVASVETANGIPPRSRVIIRQLGPANGSVVDGGISKALMAIVFLVTFLLWCVLLLAAARFRESWRASAILASAENDGRGESAEEETVVDVGAAVAGRGAPVADPGEEVAGRATHKSRGYSPEDDPFEALSVGAQERTPVTTRSPR
ncbi:MAG TPA: hypothetical protein VNY31_04580 [Solirubrobacteraceae bacterium]|jgi:hypothetical protein|nr:hypothetical protein [Solirubrobacteraceae bacterium]